MFQKIVLYGVGLLTSANAIQTDDWEVVDKKTLLTRTSSELRLRNRDSSSSPPPQEQVLDMRPQSVVLKKVQLF